MFEEKTRNSLRRLCERNGDSIVFDELLAGHSTMRIGGEAEAWYVPKSPEALCRMRTFLDDSGIKLTVMGGGSNILISDKGIDRVVLNLSSDFFKETEIKRNIVTAGAGVHLNALISECCEHGLGGLEGLAGIPATVGGAVVMNASYRTEINAMLVKVLVLDSAGDIRWMEKKDLEFGYRFSSLYGRSIVLRAVFCLNETEPAGLLGKFKGYFAEKMRKQPLDERTLGCIFKNPDSGEHTSGELIDKAGLKGYCCGAARISDKHANFIVNTGGAGYNDVLTLIEKMKTNVREKFSVELEPEIEVWERTKNSS